MTFYFSRLRYGLAPVAYTFGGGANLRASNIFGVPNSVPPSSYYSPAISPQAVSTADWYHQDGLYGVRPNDLSKMGSIGTGIQAAKGRYFWAISADHPVGSLGSWFDGQDFKGGYSDDPGILPKTLDQIFPCSYLNENLVTNPTTGAPYALYHFPTIAYAPEDTGHEFHLYGEGSDDGSATAFNYTGTTQSGSPVVTGISSTAVLVAGNIVTGAGIPSNTNTVYIGATLTGVASGTNLTVSGVVGTIVVGAGSSGAKLYGMGVPDGTTFISQTSGTTGKDGVYVTSQATTANSAGLVADDGTQVVLSQNATASATVTLSFINSTLQHECGLARSHDLVTWTLSGPSHVSYRYQDWSSYQVAIRVGSGDWYSVGLSYRNGDRVGATSGDTGTGVGFGVWTSTDGITFKRQESPIVEINPRNGTRTLNFFSWDLLNISGQNWIAVVEDARDVTFSIANPCVLTKTAHGLTAGSKIRFKTTGLVMTGNQTASSAVITGIADTSLLSANLQVRSSGFSYANYSFVDVVGIPVGTRILSVDSSSQITLTQACDASASSGTLIFESLPRPVDVDTDYYVLSSGLTTDTLEFSATLNGSAISTAGGQQFGSAYVPNGGMYVTRIAVDSNFNVLSSPAPVRISNEYSGAYPGPGYIQTINSYLEDGIYHYYVTRGFYQSANNFGFVNGGPYKGEGGIGALQQQLIDHYSEIVDATAAADAAPIGVTASCAGGVVTLNWYDALPNNIYRVYRGSSAGTQSTLVGDVAGITMSDTPTANQQWWYKIVTLHAGVEKQSRVVRAYVSSSTAFVNNHIDRVIQAGGDLTTINRTWLDTVDATITAQGLHNCLDRWVDASMGVIKDGGGVLSKIFDLGTTRLPRGKDFGLATGSPATGASTTTYSTTAIGSAKTGWINANANSYGVFGGLFDANGKPGAMNPFRRKLEISAFAYYQKASSTGDITLMGLGEFEGMALQHLDGTPGTASFYLDDDVTSRFATTEIFAGGTATSPHCIAGTYGASGNLICYADYTGTTGAGTPRTGLRDNSDLSLQTTLKGQLGNGASQGHFLCTGSKDSKFLWGSPNAYTFDNAEGKFSAAVLAVFTKELSAAQVAAVTSLILSHP